MEDLKHKVLPKAFFNRRLILVMGKGGVGKTTLATALSLTGSRQNKRVLLAIIGDTHYESPLNPPDPLPETPEEIHENIWIVHINPIQELIEYLHHHIQISFIANRITQSKLFEHLAAATPGIKEIMILGRLWRWEQEKDVQGQAPRYDMIIVDAPATGHGLNLLRLPRTLIQMLQIGPLVRQTQIIHDLLQDSQKTGIILVTLPEELPVNETLHSIKVIESELQMTIAAITVNSTYPYIFNPGEIKEIDKRLQTVIAEKKNPQASVLYAAKREINRRAFHQEYVNLLKRTFKGPILEIPYYFTNALQIIDIEAISNILQPSHTSEA